MSNEYDPIRERLDETLYEEEIDPIKDKFTEYLLNQSIDPVKLKIDLVVAQGVIALMGASNKDWTGFYLTDKDLTTKAMEHLKSILQAQMKKNCKPLKAAIQKLKSER